MRFQLISIVKTCTGKNDKKPNFDCAILIRPILQKCTFELFDINISEDVIESRIFLYYITNN